MAVFPERGPPGGFGFVLVGLGAVRVWGRRFCFGCFVFWAVRLLSGLRLRCFIFFSRVFGYKLWSLEINLLLVCACFLMF